MYYTDVFVGTDNIDKLKNALKAELKDSVQDDDLNELKALASGLGFLAGLPACLCKTKKSVEEGLKKIYKELNKNISLISCISKLNCDSCKSNPYPCKCCVIQSIKDVKGCECLKTGGSKDKCHCAGKDVSCDRVLAGLEACLHLQCLQSDMEDICQCNDSECCKGKPCTGNSPSCGFCKNLQTKTPLPTTGLGLSPPNPIRLAKRLDKFFGDSSKKHSFIEGLCTCKCGSGSCCCLSCENPYECSKSCTCRSQGCSCASKLQPPQCPRKTFCLAIDGLKIHCDGGELTCCSGGKSCHCQLEGSSPCKSGCCVVSCSTNRQTNYYHSAKCMIRRIARFFNKVKANKNCPKMCCELLCVRMFCDCLGNLFKHGSGGKCKNCNGGSGGTCPAGTKGNSCCQGNLDNCASTPDCCQGCPDCNAIKFRNAFNALQYSSPCGQDLYRLLKDFLYYCRSVFLPKVNGLRDKIKEAKKKCLSGCQPGTPCQCSSGSSCLGCKDLPEDLRPLLLQGYVSSYDSKASWASLTSSKSGSNLKCCGSLPPSSCPKCQTCSSPSSCDPSQCCPDCPQRKAAKIFLGMLPCLYYGLKILYDRSKYGSGFAGWHDISMDSNDKPESALAKFFHAWGYDLRPLKTKKGTEFFSLLEKLFGSDSSGPLQKLSTLVTEKYFTSFSHSISSGSLSPSTVRSMLIWLYGLRFHKHFSELVEICKSLCSPFGNSFHPDAFCYYIHTCCFLLPVSFISVIQDPNSYVTTFFSTADSEWKSFSYPEDLSSLFDKLCEYVRKVFAALNFLCLQCSRGRDQGGWQECWYGKNCIVKPLSSGSPSGCKCSGHDQYLCTGSSKHSSCSASSSCKSPCPHPLQRFLCHSKPNSDSPSKDYPFGLSDITPMGFESSKLSSTARDGYDLYAVLKAFCESGFCPLTRLVQFALCIFRNPPETLGELFAFFMKFKDSPVFKDFESYVDGEPGFYSGSALKKALEDLYGSSKSHSGDHSPANLYSLSYCEGPKGSGTSHPTCGRYLYPLTENAYKDFIEGFLDTYLSWVCHSAEDFKKKLKEFHEKASKTYLKCCLSSSKCKIVHCPCALPLIYSHGFTFRSPATLNNGKKSCQNFIDQLGHVANGDLFTKLLEEIPKLIWSIRKPFFLFVLAFWAFVISYFLYVQLYKLDLLHLKSHAHFSRSFKILPSTLFSDASSKLKDLSYFTL
ncbi:putative Spectrin repeat superfamily protein, Extracellular matrix-binding protein [Babesia divergens]|uniref:Spectrin repeat superfamily protein, Extracellular matrix-binding protein n=1 Tax=Babesia divergens TaxID=32595 RepID=A0AAD9GI96_BABDI|nr:putative Spectrin repeat superfamily protein, Extracellular matrix-binding protein [Babesia divergens]